MSVKVHKLADKKKELIGIIFISLIVLGVSAYTIYLVHGLTTKMYRVFGQSTDQTGGFPHFNFEKFEELGLRPKRTTSTPAVEPASATPIIPASTHSTGSGQAPSTSPEQATSTTPGQATTTPASSS